MEVSLVYAIVIGGLISLFLIRQSLILINKLTRSARVRSWVFRHLDVNVVDRHRFSPPVSRLALLALVLYWGGTAICNTLGVSSLDEASLRAAAITAFNMIPMLMGDRLAFVADVLDLSQKTHRAIHHSIGSMTVLQMSLHVTLRAIGHTWNLTTSSDRMALMVRLRQRSYEKSVLT